MATTRGYLVIVLVCVVAKRAECVAPGGDCSGGETCDSSSTCVSDICTCPNTHFHNTATTPQECLQLQALGESCSSGNDGECSGNNVKCIANTCACENTYFINGGDCEQRITPGNPCSGNDCVANAVCNTNCQCNTNYQTSGDGNSCVAVDEASLSIGNVVLVICAVFSVLA